VAVHRALEQEKIRRLIDRLKTDQQTEAATELVQRGREAVPTLIETLERRDVELRHQAFQVLQAILHGAAAFDPYAPESQRKQQIAHLRDQFERKAG
jgi:hypothetical protein